MSDLQVTNYGICGECKWHTYEEIDRGYVCTNADSPYCTEWTSKADGCSEWVLAEELWAFIKGYEGLYEVSTNGRVRSIDRECVREDGRIVHFKGCERKQHKRTYMTVTLSKNSKHETRDVHRLVAETFLVKPNGASEVNHIDGDKFNNKLSNLEWVTKGENLEHSYKVCGRNNNFTKKRRSVICVETGKIYSSIKEAARDVGVNPSRISAILNKMEYTAKGFHWTDTCECFEQRGVE